MEGTAVAGVPSIFCWLPHTRSPFLFGFEAIVRVKAEFGWLLSSLLRRLASCFLLRSFLLRSFLSRSLLSCRGLLRGLLLGGALLAFSHKRHLLSGKKSRRGQQLVNKNVDLST